MKAKHFRKIREAMQYYNVWITPWTSLFGVIANGKPACTLLARNPREAAKRAYKKGLTPSNRFIGMESDSTFGRYAVKLASKESERFTTYWR